MFLLSWSISNVIIRFVAAWGVGYCMEHTPKVPIYRLVRVDFLDSSFVL